MESKGPRVFFGSWEVFQSWDQVKDTASLMKNCSYDFVCGTVGGLAFFLFVVVALRCFLKCSNKNQWRCDLSM